MWQLFGIRYPWDGIFHHCHWEPLSQAFGDKMNDMVHIIFQHQWKLDWKLATTSKNLTKVCSPPSPGGEHDLNFDLLSGGLQSLPGWLQYGPFHFLSYLQYCFLCGETPESARHHFITPGDVGHSKIKPAGWTIGGPRSVLKIRTGGLLSAFIARITITARWRWSAGAYISRPINFCRNKLLSLDSPFSGKFPNKNHFLCNFQRDEEACMEIIGAIELVKAWQASKPAVFEGGWVMVFQDHLSCTSDDKNDQFWWSRSEYILNTTTDGVLIGRSRSFHCQRGELCYCGTQVC